MRGLVIPLPLFSSHTLLFNALLFIICSFQLFPSAGALPASLSTAPIPLSSPSPSSSFTPRDLKSVSFSSPSSPTIPASASSNPTDSDGGQGPTSTPTPTTSHTSPSISSTDSHSPTHTHKTSSPPPPPPTSSTSTPFATSNNPSSSSSFASSSSASTPSVILIPNASQQTTLSVPPTDLQAPTTFTASDVTPDPTNTDPATLDTPLSSDTSTGAPTGFLHNTPAVAGTFTAVGIAVAGLAVFFLVSRAKKRNQGIQIEDEDYVVNDRSGRTGFISVNYDQPDTEMSERIYGNHSFGGSEVEHTLGQEIIQQAPFDPFHNNFTYLDDSTPPEPSHHQAPSFQQFQSNNPFRMSDIGRAVEQPEDFVHDSHGQDNSDAYQAAWANQESAVQYRYSQHPYAAEAVHVTPLRRKASERAEYGLAC